MATHIDNVGQQVGAGRKLPALSSVYMVCACSRLGVEGCLTDGGLCSAQRVAFHRGGHLGVGSGDWSGQPGGRNVGQVCVQHR